MITKENFEKEVLNSEKLVVVDFYADWCGPCKMLAPIMSQLNEEYGDKIKIVKVNVDQEQSLAMSFQVMSIPTVLFFKNGDIQEKIVGFTGKDHLKNKIDQHL